MSTEHIHFSKPKATTVTHDELHTALKFTAGYGFLFPVSCKLRKRRHQDEEQTSGLYGRRSDLFLLKLLQDQHIDNLCGGGFITLQLRIFL